jgi:hypothetical protein
VFAALRLSGKPWTILTIVARLLGSMTARLSA